MDKTRSYTFITAFLSVLWIVGLLNSVSGIAQNPPHSISFEHQNYRYTEKNLRLSGDTIRHTAVKPVLRSKWNKEHPGHKAFPQSNNWFVRKAFREHLINYKGKGWSVQLDPLFDFGMGIEMDEQKNTWVNTRGFQVQGNIGNTIAFYSSYYENQAMMPRYIDNFVNTSTIMPVVPGVGILPGQGIVRHFKDKGAWDYSSATGYISWSPSGFLNFQFGHDRHFIGHGYRSLLLSDVSFPYPYFRMQAELGPLQYTYYLMQHIDPGAQPLSFYLGFRKKYAAMGYLNWQITDKVQLGAMQALVWPGDDSLGGSQPPSWQYMNPLIFLHPVHYSSGSEGNLLLGVNLQWEFYKNRFVYGQLMFDELRVQDFLQQTGAAANKYGAQLGMKGFDFFSLSNLFLQAELNIVRPYTYSHINRMTNYAHYLQPLAHPLGANFTELLVLADYRFRSDWFLTAKFVYHDMGLDENGINYGSNIFNSYLDAPGGVDAAGINVGQGVESTLSHAEMTVGYMVNPKTNMKVEVKYIYREQGPRDNRLTTQWLLIGFKTSLRNLYYDF